MDERDDIPNIGKDTIRSFVFGELTYHDALKVEEAVSKSEQLQNWVREYELTQEVLYQGRMEELKHLILDRLPKPSNAWRWWLGGLVLIATIGFYRWQTVNYQDAAVAKRHFLYPLDPRFASDPTGQEDFIAATGTFFDDENYSAAKAQYEELASSDTPFSIDSRYLSAHASFLLEEYEEAKQSFTIILGDDQLNLNQQKRARWNSMLTELALGNDIEEQLNNTWPDDWLLPLQEDLQSVWR